MNHPDIYRSIDNVVEPFRTSTFTLSDISEDDSPVEWTISDETDEGAQVITEYGSWITHNFTVPTHVYLVNATVGQMILQTRVTCKYVRRELRTLTSDDKERYLSALNLFYKTSSNEGKNKYGSNYVSWTEPARWHLAKSGRD